MTARRVHAVIAAGVDNPSLLAACAGEIDPPTVDALRKFAGMTIKVRHNGLRDALPQTFRLLNVTGLEIEVFSAYAESRAAVGLAPTTEERTRDLLVFLERWLDPGRREHAMLWDLVRHEHAITRLQQTTGRILHEMRADPRDLIAALHESRPPLDRIPLGERYFCYWRPDDAYEISILELDAFGFCAVSLAEGVHSTAELSLLMTGKRRPSRAFRTLLGQLADTGLVSFR